MPVLHGTAKRFPSGEYVISPVIPPLPNRAFTPLGKLHTCKSCALVFCGITDNESALTKIKTTIFCIGGSPFLAVLYHEFVFLVRFVTVAGTRRVPSARPCCLNRGLSRRTRISRKGVLGTPQRLFKVCCTSLKSNFDYQKPLPRSPRPPRNPRFRQHKNTDYALSAYTHIQEIYRQQKSIHVYLHTCICVYT